MSENNTPPSSSPSAPPGAGDPSSPAPGGGAITLDTRMPQPEQQRTRHFKKLFGGRETAEEVHSKHSFPPGSKCCGCSRTKGLQTRIITLAPLDEVRKRDPFFDALAGFDPEKFMKLLVQTNSGPYVRMGVVYACKQCSPAAERVAAKGPSWWIVDIHRGVGADRMGVGYGD